MVRFRAGGDQRSMLIDDQDADDFVSAPDLRVEQKTREVSVEQPRSRLLSLLPDLRPLPDETLDLREVLGIGTVRSLHWLADPQRSRAQQAGRLDFALHQHR